MPHNKKRFKLNFLPLSLLTLGFFLLAIITGIDGLITISWIMSGLFTIFAFATPFTTPSAGFSLSLLMITISRLCILIAATYKGPMTVNSGHYTFAFGNFIIGGNFVVGTIIFIVLASLLSRFIITTTSRVTALTENTPPLIAGRLQLAMKWIKRETIATLISSLLIMVLGTAIGTNAFEIPIYKALTVFTIVGAGTGLVCLIPSFLVAVALRISTAYHTQPKNRLSFIFFVISTVIFFFPANILFWAFFSKPAFMIVWVLFALLSLSFSSIVNRFRIDELGSR